MGRRQTGGQEGSLGGGRREAGVSGVLGCRPQNNIIGHQLPLSPIEKGGAGLQAPKHGGLEYCCKTPQLLVKPHHGVIICVPV